MKLIALYDIFTRHKNRITNNEIQNSDNIIAFGMTRYHTNSVDTK